MVRHLKLEMSVICRGPKSGWVVLFVQFVDGVYLPVTTAKISHLRLASRKFLLAASGGILMKQPTNQRGWLEILPHPTWRKTIAVVCREQSSAPFFG